METHRFKHRSDAWFSSRLAKSIELCEAAHTSVASCHLYHPLTLLLLLYTKYTTQGVCFAFTALMEI